MKNFQNWEEVRMNATKEDEDIFFSFQTFKINIFSEYLFYRTSSQVNFGDAYMHIYMTQDP